MKKIGWLALLLALFRFGFAGDGLELQLKMGNSKIGTTGGDAYFLLKLNGSREVIKDRSPVNLALVIDRSGSMAGDKVKYVREAAIQAINMLDEKLDTVSTVIYDDEIEVLYPAKAVNKKLLKSLIEEKVYDRGSTALHGGMMKGVEEALKAKRGDNITRVLLLSDGLANVGVTDPEYIATDSRKSFEKGLTITTLGVGADYNENLMVSIAKNGHGNYYFIERPSQITDIFTREFSSLLSVVAKEIVVELKPLNGTKIEEAVGYDYSGNRIEVNPIFSGGASPFLFKLKLPRGVNDTDLDVMEVKVTYYDTLKKEKVTLSGKVKVNYEANHQTSPLSDKEVYETFTDLHLSDNLEEITLYLDKGENKKAVELNKRQLMELKEANKVLKSVKVAEDIKRLEVQQQKIEALGNRHYQESEEGRVLKKAAQQDYYDKMSK